MKREDSPHYRDYKGKVRDYNGTGRWSAEEIQRRYLEYSKRLEVAEPQMPQPRETAQGDTRWIYPIMDAVIDGIARGDKACIVLGIEFIHEDDGFPFGAILKSNTARALRRAGLTGEQISQIRQRVVSMLLAGNVSVEFKEYAKLLRRIGIGDYRAKIESKYADADAKVRRWCEYLLTKKPEEKEI